MRRWRQAQEGLTKAEVARRCEVSGEAVLQWENGDANPTSANVEKFATAVGVSMVAFWGEPPAKSKRAP